MAQSIPPLLGVDALFAGGATTGLTDVQLLERFRSRRGPADPVAETAFAAIVDRHAPMVWGVCRRILDRSDAEDAFQATFLVLVRKADAVRGDPRDSLGRWLYGVARKVASRQRREAGRRPATPLSATPYEDPAVVVERRDAGLAILGELDRLPPKYRRPIELCDFDGMTYEQAGLSLGWPTATLKNRLARGRSRLRDRLIRRGLAPAAPLVLAGLAQECRAGAPLPLVHSTIRAGAIASGVVPATIARLAEGAIRTMLWEKIRPLALATLTGLGVAGASVAMTPQEGGAAAPPPAAKAAAPPKPADLPHDPRYTRKTTNGTEIEIIAVSTIPAGPKTWWKPDGTPLAEAPCDPPQQEPNRFADIVTTLEDSPTGRFMDAARPGATRPSNGQAVLKATPNSNEIPKLLYLYRISPAEADVVPAGLDGPRYQAVTRGGVEDPQLRAALHQAGAPKIPVEIRFQSRHLPIETIERPVQPGGISQTSLETLTDHSIIHYSVVDDSGWLTLTTASDFAADEAEIKHFAFDRNGRRLTPRDEILAQRKTMNLSLSRFPPPHEEIEKFEIRVRPFELVEIPDVANEPRPTE